MFLRKYEYIIIYVIFCFQVVKISCYEGSTLAFAIDDTISMSDDIVYVKKGARAIMNLVFSKKSSTIKDLVLVTINDPEVILRTKTSSRKTFLDHLDRIKTNNWRNYDCEEMSLTGMEKALENSRPGSYIYVFTDANAKDHYKLNKIKNLCQKKQSQVVIVFSIAPDCYRPHERMFTVYYDIAKACSGQVFIVQKDQVNSVLKTIEILLQGKKSILKWVTVPRTNVYVPIKFELDEKAEYAIVSTSGQNVYLKVTKGRSFTSPEPALIRTMWNNNGKVVKLVRPKSGTYYAWVKGQSTISVVVYGRTDFTFEHGFSVLTPKSMADTAKQPIAGLRQHLSIKVTDPDQSVNIKTVQILDINHNDRIINEVPLRHIGKDFYISDAFVSPKYTFRIAVKGEIKQTSEKIIRTSRTNIDPSFKDYIPDSAPIVKIDEGLKLNVNYGSAVSLTCKVTAHPAPMIKWYTSSGRFLSSKSSVVDDPLFVSYLKLKDIKKNETYICKASNKKGNGRDSRIQVSVRSAFIYSSNSKDTVYDVKYGQSVKISCNIKSYVPITIKWYRSGKQLRDSSGEYAISRDGSKLTLNSMNIGMQGKFTCEATLNSDPTVKQTQNTDVKISGLARPEIQSSNRKINIRKGGKIELKCKIGQGYPKAQVEWFKKNANSYTPISNVKSETLTVNQALLMHAGQYKCKATNGMGADSATFDVTVGSLPEISANGTKTEVSFDGNVDFTCNVESYPPPSIVWKDDKGSVLQRKVTKTSEFKFYNRLTLQNARRSAIYICEASNSVGIVTKDFEITVRPPFEVKKHNRVYDAKYGQSVKIPCNIKSYLPITIKWYQSGKQLSSFSGEYDISRDGSELKLNSMNIGMEGNYTCEATLNSDPTIKQIQNTDVKISGLARPEIQSTNRNIKVIKGGKIELKCIIGRGYPKPEVEWFKKIANSYTPLHNVKIETLTVNKALLTHAGQYKCKVTNAIGADSATFDVTVSSLPEISATETKREVPFDGNVDFMCKVEAYPPPSIVWKDEKGSVLQSKVTKTSEFEFYNRLILQNVRRSTVYICEASNSVGIATKDFEITARPLFEVKKHIQGEIGIQYGSKKTLRCDIKSTKPMSIRWYRQMKGVKSSRSVISSSDYYTISVDGTELIIKSMNLDLSGKYTCEASVSSFPTEKVAYSVQVNVVGVGPPEVTYYTTVMNGKNFTAICRIKGVPKPIISWQFKPKDSEEFTSIPGSGEELNIPELRLQHTGVYKCIGKNNFGKTEHDFNVVVEERPIIFVHNEESTLYGVEGDLVMKIPCNVTGFPEPNIVWKKGGEPLKTGPKYVVKRTTLYINKPVTSDSAEYTCEAKNKLGTDTKTSVVEIVDNFEGDEIFNGDSHDIYAEQGKSKTIKCNLKNAGEGSVRWYMDGMLTKQAGSTYSIERASVSEEGNYTCRVNTNEGSISETFVVYVGYLPIFEDNSPSPQTIDWTDDDQMLDCTADSQPPATYEWLHNGKVLAGNYLKQKRITDWGEYTCKLSNVFGYIQKTFQVTTSGCYITKNIATLSQPLISHKDKPTWPLSADNSGIVLKENEEIKLSCPNNRKSANNFKMIQSKKEITAKCSTQDRFTVEGNTYRYTDLQCNTKVEPSVLRTQNQCSGPNSEMIRVGFEVNGFMDAYKVCYDKTLNVPLYASASKFITKNGGGVDPTNFEWSSAPELGNQKIGNWKPARSCKCCYTQGQLVNVNELTFGPAQAATFKDNLNSVPIWNPKCNNSNRTSWEFFNNETRESIIFEKWSSWTGASEYVPKDGGLVPRYIWKVFHNDEGSAVMVYVNDKYPVDRDVRCSSPCEPMIEADKFLYCCTLEEFNEKFGVPLDTFKAV